MVTVQEQLTIVNALQNVCRDHHPVTTVKALLDPSPFFNPCSGLNMLATFLHFLKFFGSKNKACPQWVINKTDKYKAQLAL